MTNTKRKGPRKHGTQIYQRLPLDTLKALRKRWPRVMRKYMP